MPNSIWDQQSGSPHCVKIAYDYADGAKDIDVDEVIPPYSRILSTEIDVDVALNDSAAYIVVGSSSTPNELMTSLNALPTVAGFRAQPSSFSIAAARLLVSDTVNGYRPIVRLRPGTSNSGRGEVTVWYLPRAAINSVTNN